MMSEENRRRLVAVIALALGLFLALALLPGNLTGPLGRVLGPGLWSALGIGALGLPIGGALIGLAGFGRLGGLDTRRIGVLVGVGTVLVPYTIGVVGRVTQADFLLPHAEWRMAALGSGWLPGFLARAALDSIGLAGGLIAGFVVLTGATLATIAWHPLRRLEEGARPGGTKPEASEKPASVPIRNLPALEVRDDEDDEEAELPARVAPRPSPRAIASRTGRVESEEAAELLPPISQ